MEEMRRKVTQPSAAQLATLYQQTQSTPGYKRETMKKYIEYDSGDELEDMLTPEEEDPFHPDRVELDGIIPKKFTGHLN